MRKLYLTLNVYKLCYKVSIFLNIFLRKNYSGNSAVACAERFQNGNLSTVQPVFAIPLHFSTLSIILPFSIQVQTLISNRKAGTHFEVS